METENFKDNYRLIFNAILGPLVAVLGIIGNAFFIAAIAYRRIRRDQRQSHGLKGYMYTYLTSLALADICYMTFIGVNYYMTSSPKIQDDHDPFRKRYIVPSCNAFKAVSDFIVIFMTIDRCRTMSDIVQVRLQALKTNDTGKSWIIFLQIFTAIFLSFALYAPTYFPTRANLADANSSLVALSQVFKVICVCITKILPIIIVVVLNVIIIKRLRIVWKRRANVSQSNLATIELRRENWSVSSKQSLHEQKLAVLLVAIACSFVVLTLPANIVYIIDFEPIDMSSKAKTALFAITNFMESVNYSANFYTYCAVHQEIRQSFVAFAKDLYYTLTCRRRIGLQNRENIEMSSIP